MSWYLTLLEESLRLAPFMVIGWWINGINKRITTTQEVSNTVFNELKNDIMDVRIKYMDEKESMKITKGLKDRIDTLEKLFKEKNDNQS